jgi:hypothetical protein
MARRDEGIAVEYLTEASLLAAVPLVGLATLLAMSGPVLVRRWVKLEQLQTNNEVAGFKFATVGVLYAVLLAFAVVVVWEKFNGADSEVAVEAGAAVTIYRLAGGMEGAPGAALHEATTAYLRSAIADDWPAMARGGESPATTRTLDVIYAELLRFQPADVRAQVVMAEVLYQLDQLTQARRARLALASGIVPGILWVVLFLGAVVTIGFTFFFGAENLRAQSLMTGALSLLIFAGLLIIVAVDRPFSGSVKVHPDALAEVLADFGEAKAAE